MQDNYFNELNSINVSDKIEKKNGLSYLSWAFCWGEIKKLHPTANYKIYEREDGCIYWTDGKTAWVKTGVTINDIEHIEYLPVMDFRNQSIPLEKITSFDVNKTIQRSLTKACARHGLGLYIYAGEDLPEEESKQADEFKKAATAEKTATTKAINKAIKNGEDKLIKQPKTKEKLLEQFEQSIQFLANVKDFGTISQTQRDFINNLCSELFERGLETQHDNLFAMYDKLRSEYMADEIKY